MADPVVQEPTETNSPGQVEDQYPDLPNRAPEPIQGPEAPAAEPGNRLNLSEAWGDFLKQVQAGAAVQSQRIQEAGQKSQDAVDAARQAVQDAQAERAPLDAAVTQVVGQPLPEPPKPGAEPAIPKTGLRPFGQPRDGQEDPYSLLNNGLMMLGLIVQMGTGVSKGYANGALAAYSGALEGWAAGDDQRAKQDWQRYLAQVEQGKRAWDRAQTRYTDLVKARGQNLDELKVRLGILAAKQSDRKELIDLAFKDSDQYFKMADLEGKNWKELLDTSQKLTTALITEQMRRETHDDLQRQREVMNANAAKRITMAQRMLDYAGNRMTAAQWKQFGEPVQQMAKASEMVDKLSQSIDKIGEKNLLPKDGANFIGVARSRFNREWLNPTDPDFVTLKGLYGPVMIGMIDRGVFDEKGVRAFVAFQQQFDMVNNMPSRNALQQLMSTLRDSMRNQMLQRAALAQQAGLTPGAAAMLNQAGRMIGVGQTEGAIMDQYNLE